MAARASRRRRARVLWRQPGHGRECGLGCTFDRGMGWDSVLVEVGWRGLVRRWAVMGPAMLSRATGSRAAA